MSRSIARRLTPFVVPRRIAPAVICPVLAPTPRHTHLPAPICQRFQTTSAPAPSAYTLNARSYPRDDHSNITPTILSKLDSHLLSHPTHPLCILRTIIESHFRDYTAIAPPHPIVTVAQNFDQLGFALDHPGRAITDSYYINREHMLRAHTSAHEVEIYAQGHDAWLLSADVYRRDEIDASHYPVFHQMEGSHVWSKEQLESLPRLNAELEQRLADCPIEIQDDTRISASNPYQPTHDPVHAEQITRHLKHSLNSLIYRLFGSHAQTAGEPLKVRWIEAFFPFTTPSYEVEVWFNGEWLELLGCGVVQQKTLDQAGQSHKSGWAFGAGLERIAMVLFNIPDIRLFWSTDPRFLQQFTPGKITQFKPYSRYPECYKDMSFWLPVAAAAAGSGSASGGKGKVWHENDFCELVREVAGDLVESVTLIDEFAHPKSGRQSKCYRLNYRSMDRSLSNDEVNVLQDKVQQRVVDEMGIEIR